MRTKRWFLALFCLVALAGVSTPASARIYVWPGDCSCEWCAANMLERCAEAGGLFWCVPWFGNHCSNRMASSAEEFLQELERLTPAAEEATESAEPAR
jgi:hypothetical protein